MIESASAMGASMKLSGSASASKSALKGQKFGAQSLTKGSEIHLNGVQNRCKIDYSFSQRRGGVPEIFLKHFDVQICSQGFPFGDSIQPFWAKIGKLSIRHGIQKEMRENDGL